MERAPTDVPSAGASHDDRGRQTGAVPSRRHVVGQHVVGAGDEIDELHLRDGPEPHVGRAGGGADDGRFRDRRVDDSLLTEPLEETFRHLERAAVSTDVFAQDEDVFVALHLLQHALANCFQVRHLRHFASALSG